MPELKNLSMCCLACGVVVGGEGSLPHLLSKNLGCVSLFLLPGKGFHTQMQPGAVLCIRKPSISDCSCP